MPATRKPSRKSLSRLELDVLATIDEHHMLRPGDRVAVACSGGADSTALLHLLLQLAARSGWIVALAHFNHQLRGPESDADEQFVRDLATAHQLPFFPGRADVRAIAASSRANLEATARKLRYEFLHSLVASGKVRRVAVGHTADDQAETVLLRLIRGTGARGLAAIRPVLASGIIRPLINVRGARLRQWLTAQGNGWREDSSNQDLQLRRNLVRRKILPALAEMNPAIVEALSQTASLSRMDESFWHAYVSLLAQKYTRRQDSGIAIERSSLRKLPRAAGYRLVRWALDELRTSEGAADYGHVKSLHDWAVGSRAGAGTKNPLTLPRNIAARADRLHLILELAPEPAPEPAPKPAIEPDGEPGRRARSRKRADRVSKAGSDYCYPLTVPFAGTLAEAGLCCRLDFVDLHGDGEAYNGGGSALLDWSLRNSPLRLRSWRAGDKYRPNGRLKSRKLKELFQRHRVPFSARAGWPVLESNANIIWAKQFGVACGFAPQPGSRQALRLTIGNSDSDLDASND